MEQLSIVGAADVAAVRPVKDAAEALLLELRKVRVLLTLRLSRNSIITCAGHQAVAPDATAGFMTP